MPVLWDDVQQENTMAFWWVSAHLLLTAKPVCKHQASFQMSGAEWIFVITKGYTFPFALSVLSFFKFTDGDSYFSYFGDISSTSVIITNLLKTKSVSSFFKKRKTLTRICNGMKCHSMAWTEDQVINTIKVIHFLVPSCCLSSTGVLMRKNDHYDCLCVGRQPPPLV